MNVEHRTPNVQHRIRRINLLYAAFRSNGARKKKKATGDKKEPSGPKINIAAIGLGVRGVGNLEKCGSENIVALCDVDWNTASTAFNRYPDAAKYKDYRRMLDKEKSIDAVIVSTPLSV